MIFPVPTWPFMFGKPKGASTDIRSFPKRTLACLRNTGTSAANRKASSFQVHGPGITLILQASTSSSRQVLRKLVSRAVYLLMHAVTALPVTYSGAGLTSNISNPCSVMWIPVPQMFISMSATGHFSASAALLTIREVGSHERQLYNTRCI